jgi:hypothetical protein
MTLKTGAKLGRFEILSPIGAGGMGEVYPAKESKLVKDSKLQQASLFLILKRFVKLNSQL